MAKSLSPFALEKIRGACTIAGVSTHIHTADEWSEVCDRLRTRAMFFVGATGKTLGELTTELLQAYIEGLASG